MKKLGNLAKNRIEMEDLYFDVFSTGILELDIVPGVFAEEHFITNFEEFGWIGTIFTDSTFS